MFNSQSRFLSSYNLNPIRWDHHGEEGILEDVLKNLDRINFVGHLENLDEFASLISLSNGWVAPGHLTALNSGGQLQQKSSELLSQIPESFVAVDEILYQEGLKKYSAWRDRVLRDVSSDAWKQKLRNRHLSQSGTEWEMGFDDILYGNNFYGREGLGKETLRWMGPGLESQLFVPVRTNVTNWISVYVTAFVKPELYSTTTYLINGKEVCPIGSTVEGCTVLTFPVDSNQTASGVVKLRIQTAETASEVALNLGTDTREKSIAIRRVKVSLRPPG